MSEKIRRTWKCVRITLLIIVVAFVLEELNWRILRVAPMFSGFHTSGVLWTVAFAAAVGLYFALQTRPSLWISVFVLFVAFGGFLLYDTFLKSASFPELDRRRWEWLLPLLYGGIFGALSWVVFSFLGAVVFRSGAIGLSRPITLVKEGSETVVVFVHGLGGNAVTTWGEFPALLHADPDVRASIVLWGYPTGVFGRFPSVADAAAQLETEIRIRLSNFTNIVLVGHSLGGLVICRFIVDALKEGRAEDIKRIKHIMTFATPHDGVIVANVASFFKLGNKQVKNLGLTNETVTSLRTDWINRVYNPDIRQGDERFKKRIPLTAVVGLQDHLVPKASAMAYFMNPPPEVVPGSHTSLKLPSSTDDTCYRLLKKVI